MIGKLSFELLKSLEGQTVTNSPSSTGNWLMPEVVSVSKGKVTMGVVIKKEMCNPYGNIHGGMMATIMDEAIGWAILSADLELQYTSVSLNVDFLYAAAQGERVLATASITRAGKKIVNVAVEVHNEKGDLLAKATSNLVSTSMVMKL
jgi:acyl-coenzyme A thioesterase 13